MATWLRRPRSRIVKDACALDFGAIEFGRRVVERKQYAVNEENADLVVQRIESAGRMAIAQITTPSTVGGLRSARRDSRPPTNPRRPIAPRINFTLEAKNKRLGATCTARR